MNEVTVIFISIAVSALVVLLSSYLKKKGEGIATREAYGELLDQIKKTTHETELIKVELSRGSWVNQQQWTLRERYYVALLENLYILKSSFESLQTWYIQPGSEHFDAEHEKSAAYQNFLVAAHGAIGQIKKLHGPAELVMSKTSIDALDEFYDEYWSASEFSVCNSEWFDKAHQCVSKIYQIIIAEAKRQLIPNLG